MISNINIALLDVWGMALTRGVSSLFSVLFIPAARYAYPVVVPTVLIFAAGWREIIRIVGERIHVPTKYQFGIYLGLFIFLNIVSIYSIMKFYGAV